MITYKLSDLKEKYPSEVSLETEDGVTLEEGPERVTYVYYQEGRPPLRSGSSARSRASSLGESFRMGILEGDTVTVPKHMINAGVLILLDEVPYKLARLVFIIQEVDDLLGIYPVRYFTVEDPSDLRATHTAIEKAFEPYCGKITVEGHWALWEGVPEQGYCLDYAVLDEL